MHQPLCEGLIWTPQTEQGVAPHCQSTVAHLWCRYLPSSSTFERFLWVVGFLARNDFIVVLDNHLNTDKSLLESQPLWLQVQSRITQEP